VYIGVKSYTKGCFVTVLGKMHLEVMRKNIGQSIELLLLLLLILLMLFEFKWKEWHPDLNYFSSLI